MNKRETPRIITESPFKIVSLKMLSEAADVPYMAAYNTMTNRYSGLSDNQKTKLTNALYEELEPIFDYLGWRMELKRIKKEDRVK